MLIECLAIEWNVNGSVFILFYLFLFFKLKRPCNFCGNETRGVDGKWYLGCIKSD